MAAGKRRLGTKQSEDFSQNFGKGTAEKMQADSKGQSFFSELMY